jgi:uncharacterized protein
MESAICFGTIRHRRFEPRRHDFSYPLFMVLADIDRVPELTKISRFLSYNRFNWATFDERDHFGNPRLGLRERLEIDAAAQGVDLPDGQIFLLTHLRYLGYSFNPVSFFYCYDRAESLQAILAEVNNTFGDAENYWLSAKNAWQAKRFYRYRETKRMHVSPFNKMGLDYTFVFSDPREGKFFAHMNTLDDGRANFDATLKLDRHAWTGATLHRALLRHPWMTAKVIAAIHWEALKLYLKGNPFYPDPGARKK